MPTDPFAQLGKKEENEDPFASLGNPVVEDTAQFLEDTVQEADRIADTRRAGLGALAVGRNPEEQVTVPEQQGLKVSPRGAGQVSELTEGLIGLEFSPPSPEVTNLSALEPGQTIEQAFEEGKSSKTGLVLRGGGELVSLLPFLRAAKGAKIPLTARNVAGLEFVNQLGKDQLNEFFGTPEPTFDRVFDVIAGPAIGAGLTKTIKFLGPVVRRQGGNLKRFITSLRAGKPIAEAVEDAGIKASDEVLESVDFRSAVNESETVNLADDVLNDLDRTPVKLTESTRINVKNINQNTKIGNFVDNISKLDDDLLAELPDEQSVRQRLDGLADQMPGSEIADIAAAARTGQISDIDLLRRITARAVAGRRAVAEHSKLVFDKINSGKLTNLEARELIKQNLLLQQESGELSSQFGRSLREFGQDFTPQNVNEAKLLKRINKLFRNGQVTDDIIEGIKDLDPSNPTQVASFLRDNAEKTFLGKVREMYISSLLSAPTTQIKNILGNTFQFWTEEFTRPIAVGIDALDSAVTGRPRERFLGESVQSMVGFVHGIKEATDVFAKTFKTGISQFNPDASKIELRTLTPQIEGTLGKIVRTPLRALQAFDDVSKTLSFRANLTAEAYADAKRLGLSGQDVVDHMAKISSNPTSNPELLQKVIQLGEVNTFTNELSDSLFGRLGKLTTSAREQIPGGFIIVPFVRTLANIADRVFERGPLAFLDIAQTAARGKLTRQQIKERSAKAISGAIIGTGVGVAAWEGAITGANPGKPRSGQSNANFTANFQPYSIKIGDTYHSYAGLDPLASIVGTYADMTIALKEGLLLMDEDANESLALTIANELPSAAAEATAKNLLAKNFSLNLADFFDVIRGRVKPETYVQRVSRGFIPNIVRKVSTSIDPTIRRPQVIQSEREGLAGFAETTLSGIKEEIKNALPGIRKEVPPIYDIWGNAVVTQDGVLERLFKSAGIENTVALGLAQAADIMASPTRLRQISQDPATLEVQRLVNSGQTIKGLGSLGRDIKFKGRELSLTAEEYMRYAEQSGQDAYKAVTALMNRQDVWERLTDENKAKAISNIFTKARNKAKADIFLDREGFERKPFNSPKVVPVNRNNRPNINDPFRNLGEGTPRSNIDTGNEQINEAIDIASLDTGLEPELIAAVIKQESAFKPTARSRVGARGLMQLMPATARELGVKNSFDIFENVAGGSKYLAQQLKTFGSLRLALAAYNAGPGNVRKHGGVPPFKETKNYIRKIKATLRKTNPALADQL